MHQACGVTNRKLIKLLNTHISAESLINLDDKALRQAGFKEPHIKIFRTPDQKHLEHSLNWLENEHCHLIVYHDSDYPALLKEISSPPLLLFAQGQRDLITEPQFAIVGGRNPTKGGKQNAIGFSRALADIGLVITSGLASGIDYHGHLGALQSKQGHTIAVLGNGLDSIYPAQHKAIAQQIIERGLLLSELPLEAKPLARHFPMRNRIISGMSIGILIVEATIKSGSLITAKFALEQGREIFAIPGSIHSPLAKGCHALIKQGAKLTETIQDIVEELQPLLAIVMENDTTEDIQKPAEEKYDANYQLLLEKMGFDPITVDELVESTAFKTETITSILLALELDGIVEGLPGGRYTRII